MSPMPGPSQMPGIPSAPMGQPPRSQSLSAAPPTGLGMQPPDFGMSREAPTLPKGQPPRGPLPRGPPTRGEPPRGLPPRGPPPRGPPPRGPPPRGPPPRGPPPRGSPLRGPKLHLRGRNSSVSHTLTYLSSSEDSAGSPHSEQPMMPKLSPIRNPYREHLQPQMTPEADDSSMEEPAQSDSEITSQRDTEFTNDNEEDDDNQPLTLGRNRALSSAAPNLSAVATKRDDPLMRQLAVDMRAGKLGGPAMIQGIHLTQIHTPFLLHWGNRHLTSTRKHLRYLYSLSTHLVSLWSGS